MLVFSISDSVDHGFSVFFGWLPHVLGFIAVLLIGWIVARVAGKLVSGGTHRAGLDRAVHGGTGGSFLQRVVPRPSHLVGRIVFWAVLLSAVSLAAAVLGVASLTAFVGAIWAYLPNVLAAVLIFLVASAIAGAVVALVKRTMGDTPLGSIVATAVPVLVLTIATFMILEQLKIAHDIVVTTYTLVLGAIALASALAFGLGGRDVARQMLEGAYEKGQENKEQFRRDLDTGMARARVEAREKQEQLDSASGGSERDEVAAVRAADVTTNARSRGKG
ncbi:MAG: mechanosensitive ion channel family protein [Gaiellaceae bacterium]